jgi:nitrogen regulatory protein P-II 1
VKKIEAVIRHYKLSDVQQALLEAGIHAMTVTEARGIGRKQNPKDFCADFLPKLKLDIVVLDSEVDAAVAAIAKARTGKTGDGLIWVSNLEEAIRIRTGETGETAVRP